MSAPTVEHLQYRDPNMPVHGQLYTSPYTLADLEAVRARFDTMRPWRDTYWGPNRPAGHKIASPRRGWHGPLPAALHTEHEAREQAQAERRHAAHIAELALKARRAANPMWERLDDVMPHERCDEDVDAVMDTVYGEGHW